MCKFSVCILAYLEKSVDVHYFLYICVKDLPENEMVHFKQFTSQIKLQ